MPSRVQSTKVSAAVGGTFPFTIGSTPGAGNVLMAILNFGLFGSARTTAAPGGSSGWAKYTAGCGNTANNAIDVWWKYVAGDGTTHTFTVSEASEFRSGELFEFTGTDLVTPFSGTPAISSGNVSSLTPAITPVVINCLPVAYFTQDNSGSSGSSFSAGWTLDEHVNNGVNRGGGGGTRNTVNGDLSSVGLTITIGSGPTECLGTVILLQPPQPEATHGAHYNMRRPVLRPAAFRPGIAR